MITGEVTPDREAVVSVRVLGPTGMEAAVEAVIDTGFTEYLTLAPDVVQALALPFNSTVTMVLAGDVTVECKEYLASIEWDGVPREVTAIEAEGDALIGMGLLQGYLLTVEGVDGGSVTIAHL